MFVYTGAYTEPPMGHADGISVFRFDPKSGALNHVQTLVGIASPSFLAIEPTGRTLFAVNELADGSVTAFARDPQTGQLTELNRQPSHGAAPCNISLDPTGRFVLVANYAGDNLTVLPIAADGRLEAASCVVHHHGSSINPDRQERPHPHMVAPSPDGRFVLATDLGIDQILIYELDVKTGQLVPNRRGPQFVAAEAGSGPRHFSFALNGKVVYVLNELASTMTVYDFNSDSGELRHRQTISALPAGYTGESTCAHVAVSADGRFVYGSNRGHDSIAIWAVDPATGEVSTIGHEPTRGKTPRHFAIDPSGAWLLAANQESDSIVPFRRDPETGRLTPTGQEIVSPTPVAILFVQD